MNDPLADQSVPTRRQALRLARLMGCSGAHQNADGGWMPCASHEAMNDLIRNGKKSANLTRTIVEKDCGCGCKGAGDCDDTKQYGKPKRTYLGKKRWDKLREKPVAGIATGPTGGLYSGKDDVDDDAEAKGGYNHYARDGDMDGLVQDGTPAQRRSRSLTHRRIAKPRKRVLVAARLLDMPYPYVEENLSKQ